MHVLLMSMWQNMSSSMDHGRDEPNKYHSRRLHTGANTDISRNLRAYFPRAKNNLGDICGRRKYGDQMTILFLWRNIN
jgi:hypothetical protein